MDDRTSQAEVLLSGIVEDGDGNLYFAAHRIFRPNALLNYPIEEDALAAVIGELIGAAVLQRKQRAMERRMPAATGDRETRSDTWEGQKQQ